MSWKQEQNPTEQTCDLYRRAIAAGEDSRTIVARLALDAGVQNPAIWRRLRSGGVLPPYTTRKPQVERKHFVRNKRPAAGAHRLETLPPAVDRDPCPRCGVRGDIGCGHSRVRLGMVL